MVALAATPDPVVSPVAFVNETVGADVYDPATPTITSSTANPSVHVIAAPVPDPLSEIVIAGAFW